jgi:hypothetical protein
MEIKFFVNNKFQNFTLFTKPSYSLDLFTAQLAPEQRLADLDRDFLFRASATASLGRLSMPWSTC